ncbi:hypothetical protein F2Q69_00014291 [Brassica cretica]|uniref:Uncharacterized protein n=1 Tax=Brassica cretica TaxID=69181 RepID=A0A8S9R8R3_BRACR|nr:hypothetical protein F2Q69_00014291 [Brassica cretica]
MTEQDDDHDDVKLMTNSTKTKRACSIAQRQRGAGARLVDDTGRAWLRWRGETPRTHTAGWLRPRKHGRDSSLGRSRRGPQTRAEHDSGFMAESSRENRGRRTRISADRGEEDDPAG